MVGRVANVHEGSATGVDGVWSMLGLDGGGSVEIGGKLGGQDGGARVETVGKIVLVGVEPCSSPCAGGGASLPPSPPPLFGGWRIGKVVSGGPDGI
jgi:hypothetical protein